MLPNQVRAAISAWHMTPSLSTPLEASFPEALLPWWRKCGGGTEAQVVAVLLCEASPLDAVLTAVALPGIQRVVVVIPPDAGDVPALTPNFMNIPSAPITTVRRTLDELTVQQLSADGELLRNARVHVCVPKSTASRAYVYAALALFSSCGDDATLTMGTPQWVGIHEHTGEGLWTHARTPKRL